MEISSFKLSFSTICSVSFEEMRLIEATENAPNSPTDQRLSTKTLLSTISNDGKSLIFARQRSISILNILPTPKKKIQSIPITNHCSETDSVTQLLLLPFQSNNQQPKTCLFVGYKSGFVKIFSLVSRCKRKH